MALQRADRLEAWDRRVPRQAGRSVVHQGRRGGSPDRDADAQAWRLPFSVSNYVDDGCGR